MKLSKGGWIVLGAIGVVVVFLRASGNYEIRYHWVDSRGSVKSPSFATRSAAELWKVAQGPRGYSYVLATRKV